MRKRNTELEMELFHGTQPETVQKICKENFDFRVSGKNGTLYGQGSYFAVNASYSHQYAAKHSQGGGSRFMFLASVLVGSYTKGTSTMTRPPPKNSRDSESDLFDSCVDNETNPTIFVIFERNQCYPAFIIEYTTELPCLSGPEPGSMEAVPGRRNSADPAMFPGLPLTALAQPGPAGIPRRNAGNAPRVSSPGRCCLVIIGILVIFVVAYLIIHFFVVDQ